MSVCLPVCLSACMYVCARGKRGAFCSDESILVSSVSDAKPPRPTAPTLGFGDLFYIAVGSFEHSGSRTVSAGGCPK